MNSVESRHGAHRGKFIQFMHSTCEKKNLRQLDFSFWTLLPDSLRLAPLFHFIYARAVLPLSQMLLTLNLVIRWTTDSSVKENK